jgi:hypothetical protein
MRVAIAISAALALAGASAAQAAFVFSATRSDLPGPNMSVSLYVVNDGVGGTGTEWLGQTIVYNNPNTPVFWRTSGALAARQYNGGGNPNSTDPAYDPNFSHINAVPQTAAAADVRPFVASAFVNGVPATGTTWGRAAGITNFSIDFAATGDAAAFVPSATTPFNFATFVIPDNNTLFTITGLVGGRTGGSVPYSYTSTMGSSASFGSGTLLGNDARQTLTTSGNDPTIYTLTVNFANGVSGPALFSIDTNIGGGGQIASVGISSSPLVTDLNAVGDVVSGRIDPSLRTTLAGIDIPITSAGAIPDTAILRIIAIPEPGAFVAIGGVLLLTTAPRRRRTNPARCERDAGFALADTE